MQSCLRDRCGVCAQLKNRNQFWDALVKVTHLTVPFICRFYSTRRMWYFNHEIWVSPVNIQALRCSFLSIFGSIYHEEKPERGERKIDILQIRIKTLSYDVLNHTLLDWIYLFNVGKIEKRTFDGPCVVSWAYIRMWFFEPRGWFSWIFLSFLLFFSLTNKHCDLRRS